eukprot:2339080-Pyramimonas_sp.AAC.1
MFCRKTRRCRRGGIENFQPLCNRGSTAAHNAAIRVACLGCTLHVAVQILGAGVCLPYGQRATR